MTEKRKSGASYDDVLDAPESQVAELVHGDLYLSPRPSPRHANATSVLGAKLNSAFHQGRGGPGGWWIWDEPELHLFGNVLVPDLAGWRRSRLPELPDEVGIDLAPDWLCEVLSPSTERFDRREKLPRYALAEVGHLWLVDPQRRVLEVYARAGATWTLLESWAGTAAVIAPPFEALAIDLADLWE
jgi:Uma2 family endonuclease